MKERNLEFEFKRLDMVEDILVSSKVLCLQQFSTCAGNVKLTIDFGSGFNIFRVIINPRVVKGLIMIRFIWKVWMFCEIEKRKTDTLKM